MEIHKMRMIIDEGHIEKIVERIGANYETKIRNMLEKGEIILNESEEPGEKLCIAKDKRGNWYKIPFTLLKNILIVVSVIPIIEEEAKILKSMRNNVRGED